MLYCVCQFPFLQPDQWCNGSSVVDRGFESDQVNQKLYNWYLLLLRKAQSIKEKEERLVGSKSGCVRMGRHV